ncbi:MAG TPA: hypothetical protein VFQ85_19500 [Mycobacteriales bacterium]|jgi:Ni/Co efflux regulator RcnB|nr:hypothetical protein [Mycobacteriales bacterium]
MNRIVLAAAALAVAATPLAASASSQVPPPYSCHVTWTEVAQWTNDVPVVGGDPVYAPSVRCYG